MTYSKTLSIASFNIQKNRHWNATVSTQSSLKNLLAQHQVILLQECMKPLLLHFFNQEQLALEHWDFHFAPTRFIPKHGYMGNCILYKKNVVHPLLHHKFDFSNHHRFDQRNVAMLESQWNGALLYIFCIHFSLLRHWRRQQWDALSDIIKNIQLKNKGSAIIVGGDFNCSVRERSHFTKILHMHEASCGKTFPSTFPLRSIDTFLFESLSSVNAGRGFQDASWNTASDHIPIWSQFSPQICPPVPFILRD